MLVILSGDDFSGSREFMAGMVYSYSEDKKIIYLGGMNYLNCGEDISLLCNNPFTFCELEIFPEKNGRAMDVLFELMSNVHDSVIVLDELYVMFDSRTSSSKCNRELAYALHSSRLRNNIYIIRTHNLDFVDKRVRLMADEVFDFAGLVNSSSTIVKSSKDECYRLIDLAYLSHLLKNSYINSGDDVENSIMERVLSIKF